MAIARKRFSLLTALLISATTLSTPLLAQESEGSNFNSVDSFAGAYLAGGAALRDFDFGAAAFYYENALRFDPDNLDLKRELMIAYINNGDFDAALPLAEDLKDVLEIERISRLALGVDALRNEQFNLVQPLLILSQPNDIENLITGIITAWAHFGASNTDTALTTIDALEGPDWYSLFQFYHSALIADAAGRNEQAAKFFDLALNNASGGSASPLTYLRMIEAYAGFSVRNGDLLEAKEIIERGLGIAPNNPTLVALSASISTDSVIRFIKKPAHGASEILLNVGSAINRDGAETFASIYLEMARATNPSEPQTLFELGAIADRLGLTERSIELFSGVPAESSLFRTAALQRGLGLSRLDRNEEAVETLRGLVAESPEDYGGYIALGGVLASDQKYDDVIEVYEEALNHLDRTDDRYWPLHYRLGIAYERTKQWPQAEKTFKYALELSPNQPDILNYLGYSWVDMNINLDEGIEMIEKAVEMRPRDGYIVDSLGWAHYRLGQFEEAVEALERAADLRPRDPTINDHLGDAYWRVGRKLEAAYQWIQVLDMEPEDVDMVKIETKLEAANTGSVPFIAESSVDEDLGDTQATSGENTDQETNSDGG
ncbi:MAG: tetratricopeptide repeat protein [Pseudomonadota bacterium]